MSVPSEPAQWTVGQLRAELIGLPDDTPLAIDICTDATGTDRTRRPLIGAGYGPGIDPTEAIFTGQEFPLVAGNRPITDDTTPAGRPDLTWPGVTHPPITDQGITPTADDRPTPTGLDSNRKPRCRPPAQRGFRHP